MIFSHCIHLSLHPPNSFSNGGLYFLTEKSLRFIPLPKVMTAFSRGKTFLAQPCIDFKREKIYVCMYTWEMDWEGCTFRPSIVLEAPRPLPSHFLKSLHFNRTVYLKVQLRQMKSFFSACQTPKRL